MNSTYQKLTTFPSSIGNRLPNMSGRTPSFIVVGLVIIMFLLGLFYMSCSSKNNEFRQSLEQFEDRIRSLSIKNSDAEKKIENLTARKRELDEEKFNIQRQMEKKDSEINDLNTKFNEKLSEYQSLKSDKTVLDEQLKEFKSMGETIAAKNSLIEKLQQQLNDQKQAGNNELSRLKQEMEASKTNNQPPPNEQQTNFQIPPQRYRPYSSTNQTRNSIASLFRDPLGKLNNMTKEVRAQFVPAVIDVKDKVSNASGVEGNSTNQQPQEVHENKVDQNVLAPPLADNAQRQQQAGHVESAQAAPRVPDKDGQAAVDNLQKKDRLERSINNTVSDDKNPKRVANIENDDEEQLEMDRNQPNKIPSSTTKLQENIEVNNNHPIVAPAPVRSNDKYRVADRERSQLNRVIDRQEKPVDKGEEIIDDAHELNHQVRKSRLV